MTVPKVYFMWDAGADLKEFLRSGLSNIETELYFKDELSYLKRWNEVVENIKRFSRGRTDLLNIVNIDEGY
ncbi:MAG: hypothetical protein KAS62_12755 [Candidatus Delongbacteria bacterium]|nr:hypothetical protein [Candidatus Delongbacteria bacterium]